MWDTGSGWLWVNEKDACTTCDDFKMAPGFDCHASSSCENSEEPLYLAYGRGTTDGHTVQDRVSLSDTLTVDDHIFGLATTVTDSEDMEGANGICGLGRLDEHPSLLQHLKSAGKIEELMFSMALTGGVDDSSIVIGGVDAGLIDATKTFYTLDLVPSWHLWTTALGPIEMYTPTTSKDPHAVQHNHESALIDSGTSHITLDTGSFNSLQEWFTKHQLQCTLYSMLQFQCTIPTAKTKGYNLEDDKSAIKMVNAIFPTLNLTLSGQEVSLEPEFYIAGCQSDDNGVTCDLLLAPYDFSASIVGSPLFMKYVVGFYEDKKTIMIFHAKPPAPKRLVRRSIPPPGVKYSMFSWLALPLAGLSMMAFRKLSGQTTTPLNPTV